MRPNLIELAAEPVHERAKVANVVLNHLPKFLGLLSFVTMTRLARLFVWVIHHGSRQTDYRADTIDLNQRPETSREPIFRPRHRWRLRVLD